MPFKPDRPSWDEYFLQLAGLVATRSTCMRRQVGAVLVKNKRIIATGYNGAPMNLKHCQEVGCLRARLHIPSGQNYEICRGIHAEQNAIVNAAFYGIPTENSVLYSTTQPCVACARMLINAGVLRIVHQGDFQDALALEMLQEAGILVEERSLS
jgi:dCMP deaminase